MSLVTGFTSLSAFDPVLTAKVECFEDWHIAQMPALAVVAAVLAGTLEADITQHLSTLQLPPRPHTEAQALDALQTVKWLQEVILRQTHRDTLDIQVILDQVDKSSIRQVIQRFVPPSQPSLLEYLGAQHLVQLTPDDIREYPLQTLAAIAASPWSRELAADLIDELNWYGSAADQQDAPLFRAKLVIAALELSLDATSKIEGFDLNDERFIGASYPHIRRQLEDHLLHTARVQSASAAALGAYVLEPRLPPDFRVSDIPDHLGYRTSTLWVSFNYGAALAETIEPGSAQRMSFSQLAEYPLTLTGLAESEPEKQWVSAALIHPVLAWATATGRLPRHAMQRDCSPQELDTAVQAYVGLDNALIEANLALRSPMPMRLKMAEQAMRRLGIDSDASFNYLDGSRLTARLLDLAAAGMLKDSRWTPALIKDRQGTPRVQWVGPYQQLPDLLEQFETAHTRWLKNTKNGYRLIVRELLSQLPNDAREAIEKGVITLGAVGRLPFKRWERYSYTRNSEASLGHYGFIVQAVHDHKHHVYEVFPHTHQIIARPDLPALHVGGQIIDSASEDYRQDIVHYPQVNQGKIPDHSIYYRRATLYPLDYNAYARGSAPAPRVSEELVVLEIGRIPAFDAIVAEKRLDHLAYWVSHAFLHGHDDDLYVYAKGVTQFDEPSPVATFFKTYVLPFWASIEELTTGIKQGNRFKIIMASIGLVADALSLIVPGSRAALSTVRVLQIGARAGLRAVLPDLGRVAVSFAARVLRNFNPASVLIALVQAGRRQLPVIASLLGVMSELLREGIKQVRRRLKTPSRYERGLTRISAPSLTTTALQPYQQWRVVSGHSNVLVSRGRRTAANRARHHLIDPHTRLPFGPPLRWKNDNGDLIFRGSADVPVEAVPGGWQLVDNTPDLTKHWVIQGSELYLESAGVYYRKTVTARGKIVLRRSNAQAPPYGLPRIKLRQCRAKRGELALDDCNPLTAVEAGFSGIAVTGTTAGRDAVAWFTDRSISLTSASGRMVHNQTLWKIKADGGLTRAKGPGTRIVPDQYLDAVQATVQGGNDLFKQIRITGGIYQGVEDSRVISAVLAKRRNSPEQILVTRADDNAYYRAHSTGSDGPLTMQRMNVDLSTLHGRAPTEDEFLALIYNGSYDANGYIRTLDPTILAADLHRIQSEIVAGKEVLLRSFIGGPFHMGTSAAEAALFCQYARTEIVIAARASAHHWQPISSATPMAARSTISQELNTLFQTRHFTADSILDLKALKNSTRYPRNLAYARLRFKPETGRPDHVYYGLSGSRRPGVQLPLSQFASKPDAPHFTDLKAKGWSAQERAAIHPDGTRYIDIQPKRIPRTADPDGQTTLFFPDLAPGVLGPVGNTRLGDTEQGIMRQIKQDNIDLSTVDSLEVFTVLPTCQSCTLGLTALGNQLPAGKFTLHEGPQARRAPLPGTGQ